MEASELEGPCHLLYYTRLGGDSKAQEVGRLCPRATQYQLCGILCDDPIVAHLPPILYAP